MKSAPTQQAPDGSTGTGQTFRFQAGLVILVPFLLVFVAIALGQWQRVNEFRDASALSQATTEGAALIAAETAVRQEWLSALDIATIETTDFVAISDAVFDRAIQLGPQTRLAFEESTRATDRVVVSLDATALSGDGNERLERLDELRSRVLERDTTPAELDLFYSRLVNELRQFGDAQFRAIDQGLTSAIQLDVLREQRLNATIVDTNSLQLSLTQAVEDLVAVRPPDWGDIERSAIAARISAGGIDQLGLAGAADQSTESFLATMSDVEAFALAQDDGVAGDDTLTRVLELRADVVEHSQGLLNDFEVTADRIATSGRVVRTDALQSLITTGLLLLASAILLAAAIGYLSRSIVRPLRRAADIAARVSRGDLNVKIDEYDGPREVRLVSSALSELVETVSLIERQAVAMSGGELGAPVLDERLPGQLGRYLESSIGRWRDDTHHVHVASMITAAVNEATSDAQLLCDGDLVVTEANPAAELVFEASRDDLVGVRFSELASVTVIDAIDELGENGTVTDEAVINGRAGEIRTLATITRVTTDLGRVHSILLRDVSDRQQILDRLSFEVQHDRLTGLRSRQSFVDTLSRSLEQESTGVIVIDIDDFGKLNALFGEWAGDQVLHVLTDRLSNGLEDATQIGRLGGDEFAVSTPAGDLSEAARLAEQIHGLAKMPVRVADQVIELSVSIGVALAKGVTPDVVIGDAMIAVRHAKRSGGDKTVLFDEDFEAYMANWRRVESDLVQAIEDDALELYFQPIIEMANGTVVGAEALLRWPREDGSLMPPNDFIPLAEASTLIIDLDRWVIDSGCRALSEWGDPAVCELHLAVNVSGRHLSEGDLVTAVRESCSRWNVDPSRLGIEVTESVLLEDRHTSLEVLKALSELGVTLLIDDFGTGYSNLSYLQDFPFDVLKIDRSFVSRSDTDARTESLVGALVGLGRAMGLEIHAEGVETEGQRALLRDLGCDFEQGYLFSKPLPIADFVLLCGQHMTTHSSATNSGVEEIPLAS